MSIEIKRLKKDGIKDLKNLFEKTESVAAFSPFIGHTTEEFEWSFFSADYEEAIYIVAKDTERNEILGTTAGMYIPMQTPEGQVCQTIKGEDTLVNIDGLSFHPKRDLFKEMYEQIYLHNESKDVQFYWGFSNTPAVKAHRRIGYVSNFSSQQGIYVIKPLKAYTHLKSLNSSNGMMQKIQILGLAFLSNSKRILRSNRRGALECKEIDLEEVNEDKLLSFLPSNHYSIHLSKAFLDWRIRKNPSKLNYSILQITEGDRLIAYLIYSIKNDSIFFIEQILFEKSLDLKTKNKVVSVILDFLKRKNAIIVRAMGFEHNSVNVEERAVLISSGFIFIKKGMAFVFMSRDKSISPENIYLSRLNTQGIY